LAPVQPAQRASPPAVVSEEAQAPVLRAPVEAQPLSAPARVPWEQVQDSEGDQAVEEMEPEEEEEEEEKEGVVNSANYLSSLFVDACSSCRQKKNSWWSRQSERRMAKQAGRSCRKSGAEAQQQDEATTATMATATAAAAAEQQENVEVVKKDRTLDSAPIADAGGSRTVMIRNIACRYSQEDVRLVLDSIGLGDKYDFIYVPMNAKRRANLGYFFVNFIQAEFVEECMRRLAGRVFGDCLSEKLCEVSQAHLQGNTTLARHFRRFERAGWSMSPCQVNPRRPCSKGIVGEAGSEVRRVLAL